LLALVLLIAGVPLALWSTTAAMIDVWIVNETFTHGFLILPISLWLIWQQRHSLGQINTTRDFRALLILTPLVLVWLLAAILNIAVIQQLAMVALIPVVIWLALGFELTWALAFPLAYLFFSVPLGQSLIPPMMEFTADFTVYLIQLSGIPVFRDGLYFQLPTGSWAVVEECSGVRYLIASAALGTIYAYTTYQSTTKRLTFVVISLVVPILANGLRAYGIVMIGHFSGMQYAVGADHLLYGWVFFGIVIFALFSVGGIWADPIPDGNPEKASEETGFLARDGFAIGISAIALLAFVGYGTDAVKATPSADAGVTLDLKFNAMPPGWIQLAGTRDQNAWRPEQNNPDVTFSAHLQRESTQVYVDIAYYRTQREGAEAISSLNRLSDPYEGDWKLTAQRRLDVGEESILETELTRQSGKVLVWSAFLVGRTYESSSLFAKLLQARQFVFGNQSASWVTIATPFDDSLESVRERIESSWTLLTPKIIERIDELDGQLP
ncbi:MAG: exosortase A, partial [Pseudomonadota bacterium]